MKVWDIVLCAFWAIKSHSEHEKWNFFFHFECEHYCVDNRTKLNEKQENEMNVKYVNEMNVKYVNEMNVKYVQYELV